MFTVQQRDAVRDRLLALGQEDERVVAGAAVGSIAVEGGGDRFSDLDLTFGIADDVPVDAVLSDWTRMLADELAAVHLVPSSGPPVRDSGSCSGGPLAERPQSSGRRTVRRTPLVGA